MFFFVFSFIKNKLYFLNLILKEILIFLRVVEGKRVTRFLQTSS
jgi:hypothetical protein